MARNKVLSVVEKPIACEVTMVQPAETVETHEKAKKPKKGAKPHSYRIIPAQPGRVAIFFPAKKEVSGLRFHLHAPFVPELSRASIDLKAILESDHAEDLKQESFTKVTEL